MACRQPGDERCLVIDSIFDVSRSPAALLRRCPCALCRRVRAIRRGQGLDRLRAEIEALRQSFQALEGQG